MPRSGLNKFAITLSAVLIIIGITAAGYIAYMNNPKQKIPLVYSQNAMLLEMWNAYKTNNLEMGSLRTLDKSQDNITTSEGQSYTMMRAVWSDDRATFDKSWQWTKDNLQRDDKLMSWKFGLLPNGQYGIQDTIGGQNTASDGDSDIALSLLMAYSRWNDYKYYFDAKPIIESMWEREVVTVNGKPVLASNDLERHNTEKIIVNPSYFAPYAYKVFAQADQKHDWKGLADNSYSILNAVSDSTLDKSTSTGLPPDWISMDRKTGEISATNQPNLTTNYGYDAFRTPWRMALDWAWYKDDRAKQVLSKYSFLDEQWQKDGQLKTGYSHDGKVVEDYETPAAYGGAIGYFKTIKPDVADDVYKQKLQSLYDPDEQKWKTGLKYYDDNWAWFGIALMEGELPNLTEQ